MSVTHSATVVPITGRNGCYSGPVPTLAARHAAAEPLAVAERSEAEPRARGEAEPQTETPTRGEFCGIMYVARALRLEAVDIRTVVAHVRAHIGQSGFPAPVSSRLRGGKVLSGAALVTPKSEWLRAAVDAWIDARAYGESGIPGPKSPDRAAHVEALLAARLAGQNAGAGA